MQPRGPSGDAGTTLFRPYSHQNHESNDPLYKVHTLRYFVKSAENTLRHSWTNPGKNFGFIFYLFYLFIFSWRKL
jgi:hypothetical protein